jgi:hypothetical protein
VERTSTKIRVWQSLPAITLVALPLRIVAVHFLYTARYIVSELLRGFPELARLLRVSV